MKRLLVAFSIALCISGVANPQSEDPARELLELVFVVGAFENWSAETRLDVITQSFLNVPAERYDHTGEAAAGKFDKDPRFCTSKMNCTTFVEHVIAATWSSNMEEMQEHLDKIRYRNGEVSFLSRNHFVSTDWNPNNERAGYVEDITQAIADGAGVHLSFATKTIHKKEWLATKAKSLDTIQGQNHLSDAEKTALLQDLVAIGRSLPPVEVALPYLDWQALFEEGGEARQDVFNAIPTGVVINIVGHLPEKFARKWGWNLNVLHQGIGLRHKDGKLYYWNASTLSKQKNEQRVKPILLSDYLKIIRKNRLGINILEIQLPN